MNCSVFKCMTEEFFFLMHKIFEHRGNVDRRSKKKKKSVSGFFLRDSPVVKRSFTSGAGLDRETVADALGRGGREVEAGEDWVRTKGW